MYNIIHCICIFPTLTSIIHCDWSMNFRNDYKIYTRNQMKNLNRARWNRLLLKDYLKAVGLTAIDNCHCGSLKEDIFHYFLECHSLDSIRISIMDNIYDHLRQDFDSTLNDIRDYWSNLSNISKLKFLLFPWSVDFLGVTMSRKCQSFITLQVVRFMDDSKRFIKFNIINELKYLNR